VAFRLRRLGYGAFRAAVGTRTLCWFVSGILIFTAFNKQCFTLFISLKISFGF